MKKYAALFVREDSDYKSRVDWDCYDIKRDALNYKENFPVVCHPPCRSWGRLSHMAFNVRPGEKELAFSAIEFVRKHGGILEHPKGSKLFKEGYLPPAGKSDEFGKTIEIDQFDFGHVARKGTYLYICGTNKLPRLPPKNKNTPLRSIGGNVKGTIRCTDKQREYTPRRLINWFERCLNLIIENK